MPNEKEQLKKLVEDIHTLLGIEGEKASSLIRNCFNNTSDPELVGFIQEIRWATSSIYAACLGYVTKYYGKVDIRDEFHQITTRNKLAGDTSPSNSTSSNNISKIAKPIPKTTDLNALASLLAKSLRPEDLAKMKGDE